MTFKSNTQPSCLYCGNGIAKATETIHLWKEPKTIAEIRASTNLKIVSWRYGYEPKKDDSITIAPAKTPGGHGDFYFEERVKSKVLIDTYSTWDGVSYVDEFFCNGTCCRRYAYRMARKTAVEASRRVRSENSQKRVEVD